MKLLLTAAGTGTGFGYGLAIAKNFPEIQLLTADTNPSELVTTSLFAAKHLQLLPFRPDGYAEYLNSKVVDEHIDFYVPLIDKEILYAAENHEKFQGTPAVNNQEFCKSALTKSLYTALTKGESITAPRLISEADFLRLENAVAKKDGGFGSRDTVIKNAFSNELIKGDGWHYYEYILGDEFTVDCFPDPDGSASKVTTSVRRRIETKAGVCTKTEILEDARLRGFASSLVERFNLTHPFCFQTRFDGRNHYLIDINPRLGAGSTMSALNGTDFFSAHLSFLCGKDPAPYLKKFYKSCIVTRQYSEYLMASDPYENRA